MELAIGKTDFARALSSVSKAVESRNTIPILSHVRLVATTGRLQVTGTDLDITVTDTAPADITAPGAVCVDAKLLSSIVAKVGGDINLKLEADKLIVKSGRSRFTLSVLPADAFPDLPEQKYDAEFEIDLAGFFGPVAFAISTEETRFYLNGVFFKGGIAAATDGHRLAKNTTDNIPDFEGIIVPRKTVGLLPKGTCRVAVSSHRIRVTKDDLTIESKLIDGTFPDYERVIPKSNDKIISFDNDEMRQAAARVSVVASERGRAVRLSFAGNAVVLTVSSPETGTATDEMVAAYEGEPIEIGFNSSYLAELVGMFPPGDIKLALADPGSPSVFTSDKAPELLAVLMPMRV